VERRSGPWVLVVDGDAQTRARCVAWLAESRSAFQVVEAASLERARVLLETGAPDCIVLAEALPDGEGTAFLREAGDVHGQVPWPVVLLASCDDAERAVAAIQAGAQDYAVKERMTGEALARSVRNAIEKRALRRDLEREREVATEARARELEMKEELLSHVSHELRTPLTAIHQFVSIVLDEAAGQLNARQKEFLAIAYRNAQQLRDMIGDLMEVARGGAGRLSVAPAVMPLAPAIEAALDSLRGSAQEKRMAIEVDVAGAPDVLADCVRVRQIVANLLGNALKFSPPDGVISVRAASEADRESVRVSVEDRGCGIPAEAQPHVFERMYQAPAQVAASRRGLGLGLYICRELVAGHGGRIWLESQVGRGSTFHFTLPAYRLERVLAPLFDPDERASRRCHLLVLDLRLDEDLGSSDDRESLFAALQAEIEAQVHRNRDVVIPRKARSAARVRDVERCFVVAQAGLVDVRAMAARLTRALGRSDAARAAGLDLEIRFHPIELPACAGAERGAWLEGVATAVQRQIDAELCALEAERKPA
jgi:signal transduction histidine kinase